MFKKYSRKGFAEARELQVNEGLAELLASGVSVSEADKEEFGNVPNGLIFRNADNQKDKWYVARAFFNKNYNSEPIL